MENEKILLEKDVKYKRLNTKLILTEERIIFQRKKGIFRKTMKIVNQILLDDIKVYNDKVGINCDNNIVNIETLDKRFTITCTDKKDAKKVVEEVEKIKLGSKIERGISKLDKVVNFVNASKKTLLFIAGAAIAIKEYFDKKK